MLGNSQFFKIKVYLTRTKNYKKSQPFLGKVRVVKANSAFVLNGESYYFPMESAERPKAEGRILFS